jgi:hypothetical protein
VIHIVDELVKRKIRFTAIKESIHFEGKQDLQTKVMVALFGLFAEVERDLIYVPAAWCSPPQLFEPCWVGGRVLNGVVDVAVSEVILNEPSIRALIGKGEAPKVS